ncbi:MAG: hypothetical protein IJN63_10525, partial [Clostridia bacterium]|nr:hypothetical protein [Clostridia bacterium]
MKKLLSLFLASLMVLAVIPATGVQFVVAADVVTENTAYLQPTSGNDATAKVTLAGESNKNPFKTITKAYNSLAAAGGGRLIIEENFTFSSGISSFDAHSSLITISAASDAVGIEYVGGSETHWIKFAGPVVFENIKFVTSHTFYLLANHNPLTIGEGVSCVYNDGTAGIVIAGGTFNISGVHCNTDVTVKSGNWRCVVGGGVASNDSSLVTDADTGAKTSKNQNGTFKITIENGTVGTLIGGNWATSKSYFLTGGQAYMYVKGGTVGQLYYGGNDANQATLHNGVLVYTGGHIGTIKAARTMGICTLIYGENLSRNETDYPNAAFSLPANSAGKEYKNVFVANVGGANKNVSVLTVNKLNVIPLATSEVVYVNTTGPFADNETGATALGTKDDPVRYMHQAIAMLTYTGGTIMLDTDYTFAARELNGMSQFVEPDHAPIIIDGQGHKLDGPAGMKSHVDFASATDGRKTTVAYGYNTYLMNGDTTFKNVDVAPSHDMNFAANYNSIVFGKGVVTTNVAWISGAIFLNNSYNSGTYVNNHYDVYQYYRDAD